MKWPTPNLYEDVMMLKSSIKRPLLYLDQNIICEMSREDKSSWSKIDELLKTLEEKCYEGKMACPYSPVRRTESIEVEKRWQRIDDILKKISFGITLREWQYALFYELKAAKDKIDQIVAGKNNFSLPYQTYFESNPNKDVDDRIIDFLDTSIRINAFLPINEYEKKMLKELKRSFNSKVVPAKEADKELRKNISKNDFIDYLIEQMHLVQRNPQMILHTRFDKLYGQIKINKNSASLRNIWFYLPLLWISMNFEEKILSQKNRGNKNSDFYDMTCNSLALLSCSYMIIDKEMANIAKQLKFDQMFKCQVFPTTNDGISEFLTILGQI